MGRDVRVAVIGCGYWGKNLVRNFFELAVLEAVCDEQKVVAKEMAEAYNVKDPYLSRQIPLSDMKHWELAASNPSLLKKNGNTICLSYNGSKTPEDFWKNLI